MGENRSSFENAAAERRRGKKPFVPPEPTSIGNDRPFIGLLWSVVLPRC
jgi:hypothetical protein